MIQLIKVYIARLKKRLANSGYDDHILGIVLVGIILLIFWLPSYVQAQPLEFFTLSEFTDSEPPYEVKMNQAFLLKLDELRRLCGFPIYIKSGYRSPNNSDEKYKRTPGTHSKGIAVDIIVSPGHKQLVILKYALQIGFTGIGLYPSHIHLDTRKTKQVIWVRVSYNVHHARDNPKGNS